MARIAFFLDTRRVRSADIRDVAAGNPGIGGTEYMFFLVAAYLARTHEVSMYVTAPGRYPPGIRYVLVQNLQHAAVAMWAAADEIAILRENEVLPNRAALNAMKQRVIVWAHNFSKPETLETCAKCASVARFLCVSRQQHETLRDHDVFRKSDYVYNAVASGAGPTELPVPTEDNVFYMGSLVKSKGFHVLARHWADIVRAVPTARLHVVGSGRLYDENAQLGPLGLASPEYEQQFAAYVTDGGRLREDIVFHGVLGADKWRLLRRAKVAVANPTGVGETFCITAIEFGLLGVPVVTRKFGGPIDVVADGVSGILFDHESELAPAVVGLLKDEKRRREMGRNAMQLVRSRFDIEIAIGRWQQIIREVMAGAPVVQDNGLRVQRAGEAGHGCGPAHAAVRGVCASLLRRYLRYSPIEPGKRWLWERVLEKYCGCRLDWSAKVASTPFAFRLNVDLPDAVEDVIHLTGRWQPFLTEYLRTTLTAGDTFVDVGAGIGYYSLLASRVVGPGGHVYSFEFDPSKLRRFEANLLLNEVANVDVVNAIAGEGDRNVPFRRVPEDRLFGARLIKFDLESMERSGLQTLLARLPDFSGTTAWVLKLFPPADVEAQGSADRIFDAFLSRGYSAFAVPDSYDPRGFLARPRSARLMPLRAPPALCADVIFSKPAGSGTPISHGEQHGNQA